ncbi:MAG: glycosyltransferase family 2 protein [Erysipelotrichia bacterium]|nr:glycosyltransferase family 2 protein [Erysipelotrichia bacterium]
MENTRDITKECTLEDKVPLVSIVLALYNPNLKWLEEQLISINRQTYTNIELLVMDDCSDSVSTEGMEDLVYKCINRFEFEFFTKEKNEGSNKTFERLTELANGEYIAYCDQDDIWLEDKIAIMIDEFSNSISTTLIYSDMSIIDESDNEIADSIRDIRKRLKYKEGFSLSKDFLIRNFVSGCSMMVKSEIAKNATPFVKTMVHDQWIALSAAIKGQIRYINKPLVCYRQHGTNQTGVLFNISNKNSYFDVRVLLLKRRYEELGKRISDKELLKYIEKCELWLEARESYLTSPNIKSLFIILRYSYINKLAAAIEILLPVIPDILFMKIIELAKKGVI